MTPLIYATLILCLAIGAGVVALALYLHILGRRLADVSERLHVARRNLATTEEPDVWVAYYIEIGLLETESHAIRERIRRIESYL